MNRPVPRSRAVAADTAAPTPVTDPNDRCPSSSTRGKRVRVITLKALLRPEALARLDPRAEHRVCADPGCEIVYFADAQAFARADLKVPVYRKDPGAAVPVCYCFGVTRADVAREAEAGRSGRLAETVAGHVRANRCGCEVNNPQGSCCLGDLRRETAGASLTRAAPGRD